MIQIINLRMLNYKLVITLFLLILLNSCSLKKQDKSYINFIENFNSKETLYNFWEDASQSESPMNYDFDKEFLRIISRANTKDRVKVKTKNYFVGSGSYSWRVYVPKMHIGDQCSIGAFLYFDDKHELDFEIGSGNKKIRKKLNAKNNDLVVYCTSQAFPFSSTPFLIKNEAWYNLKIEITQGKNNNFLAKWFINDKLYKTEQLEYKSKFYAFCSIENLEFIGDNLPKYDNYTLFDWFKFKKY